MYKLSLMTLYLKYRPQKIEELDLLSVRDQLQKILSSKDIPHAFLFSGPRGTGKTSAARILAMSVNKTDSVDSPDIIELDAASNRGIDEVRTLREQIVLSPMSSKYKVYIIDEVHMLTTEAANALLKTLEEPPAHAIFVLCTTDPQKLPETVVSRCTQVSFPRPSLEEILAKLKLINKAEKSKFSDEDLGLLAKSARGSFRDAIKFLEQAITSGRIVADFGDPAEFIELLKTNETKKALKFVDTLATHGTNLREFIERCVEVLREELLKTLDKSILGLIEAFEKAYEQSKTTAVPQLPLEVLVINNSISVTVPSTPVPVPVPVVSGDVQLVLDKWQEILKAVRPFNHSVEGLLRSTKPIAFDGVNLVLEVFYKFHKDKLSEEKCKKIVEEAIMAVLDLPKVTLKLNLGKSQPKVEEDLAKVAEGIFK